MWHRETLVSHTNKTESHSLIDRLILCVYFLIILQWFIFSFKLRKENKLIRTNEILLHPECQRFIHELKAVNNLDELSIKYGESVRACPQIASTFKKIYEERLVELSQLTSSSA